MEEELNLKWLKDLKNDESYKKSPFVRTNKRRRVETPDITIAPEIIKTPAIKKEEIKEIEKENLTEKSKKKQFTNYNYISNTPIILIGYLHLILNAVVIFVFIYAFLSFSFYIKKDILNKIQQKKIALKNSIVECRRNYVLNKCDPKTRVPGMNDCCTKWEVGMKRGLDSVDFTNIVLSVIGDACDTFTKKFSLKSILICAGFFIIFLMFRNSRIGSR